MTLKAWLNNDRQLQPGAEIFRSDRRFHIEAYSASHGQLLFRSNPDPDGGDPDTTIDLLFKPIEAVKIRDGYRGLAVRCATVDEADRIKASITGIDTSPEYKVFLLESQGTTDYVISLAVGWAEDVLRRTQYSFFNTADEHMPCWPTQPLHGISVGFNVASVEDLIRALQTTGKDLPHRERFRMVYVLMTRVERRDGPDVSGAGVFLTEEDAQDAHAQLAPKVDDCWIQPLPIAL